VPKSVAGNAQSYPYKMRYSPGPNFSPTKAAEEASRLLSEREPSLREIIVTDSAGKLADRLYVRQAADASAWAIVNLTGETRRLKLRKGSGKGNAGVFKDQLTGQTVRGSLLMKPYAVRVLSVK
ncbi:MAG: hypothetical protein GXP29_04240, partial [Planctomycetes bacterium]|nr:hypothetical protein [Planctomycetota bacterium]